MFGYTLKVAGEGVTWDDIPVFVEGRANFATEDDCLRSLAIQYVWPARGLLTLWVQLRPELGQPRALTLYTEGAYEACHDA